MTVIVDRLVIGWYDGENTRDNVTFFTNAQICT